MASIGCAHCKGTHSSVAEVRACATDHGIAAAAETAVAVKEQPKSIREQINEAVAQLPDLPRMRYAIKEIDTEHGGEAVWRFYCVERPTKGKWAGYAFVSAQASDDLWPIRDQERRLAILTAIAFDPEQAASDYGHQIGECGICGRTLTNPESIARGIGPICAGKAGW